MAEMFCRNFAIGFENNFVDGENGESDENGVNISPFPLSTFTHKARNRAKQTLML
jgi:hypothetical protein